MKTIKIEPENKVIILCDSGQLDYAKEVMEEIADFIGIDPDRIIMIAGARDIIALDT